MFKPRSPFQIPTSPYVRQKNTLLKTNDKTGMPENSSQFGNISTVEPQFGVYQNNSLGKMDEERDRSVSMRKNEMRNEKLSNNERLTPTAISTSTLDEKFCLRLFQKVAEQDDDTLLWEYPITSQVTNEYSRKLILRQQEYLIRGIDEAGIADVVYLVAEGIPGYKDNQGVITNRVCSLHLSESNVLVDDAGIRLYDVVYRQSQDVAWDIPMNLTAVKLRLEVGEENLDAPLSIPFICQIDIRHMGK